MKQQTTVSIITIGDELLIGQVLDTNSAFIAAEMNKAGYRVTGRSAAGDNKADIIRALDHEKQQADVIIITGGLGPTADDITKPLLAEYFGSKMIRDKETLKNVSEMFANVYKRELTDRNMQQADVPADAELIQNKKGTAPGMIFSQNGKLFFSLPGVPHEMRAMITGGVIQKIKATFTPSFIAHRTILTAGVGEATLADRLVNFETALPSDLKLAYLPSNGMVRLRLTQVSANDADRNAIDIHFASLKSLTEDVRISDEDLPIEKILDGLLSEQKKTLALAESCTGGLIAHTITQHAGASSNFLGGTVVYSNDSKTTLLGVNPETIKNNGAVSEKTVHEMITGTLRQFKADYAIAVSGIMGPGNGSEQKETGTTWIAVGNGKEVRSKMFLFKYDRERNIRATLMNALLMLIKAIKAGF